MSPMDSISATSDQTSASSSSSVAEDGKATTQQTSSKKRKKPTKMKASSSPARKPSTRTKKNKVAEEKEERQEKEGKKAKEEVATEEHDLKETNGEVGEDEEKSFRKKSFRKSNPFSTGGGGGSFENRVQAYFVATFLIGGSYPYLGRVKKTESIELQAPYGTDDLVISYVDIHDQRKKALMQIKHKLDFTKSDDEYKKTLLGAWSDFNSLRFNRNSDVFVIVISNDSISNHMLKAITDVFEYARTSANKESFYSKCQRCTGKGNTKEKLEAIKTILAEKMTGRPEENEAALWTFCKCFHVLKMDMDEPKSKDQADIISKLTMRLFDESPMDGEALWDAILNRVADFNKWGGTITLDTIPAEILLCLKNHRKPFIESFFLTPLSPQVIVSLSSNEDWKPVRSNNEVLLNCARDFDLYLKYPATLSDQTYRPRAYGNKDLCNAYTDWWGYCGLGLGKSKIGSFDVELYYKGRSFQKISLACDNSGLRIVGLIPKSPELLLLQGLDLKIAAIVAQHSGLFFQNPTTEEFKAHSRYLNRNQPPFDPLLAPLTTVDMKKVQNIIETKDINRFRQLIEVTKQAKEENWYNYIFEPEYPPSTISADMDHANLYLRNFVIGNVMNLCMKHKFYRGAKLLLDYYGGKVKVDYSCSEDTEGSFLGVSLGRTPLMMAAANQSHVFLMKLLLEKGTANPNLLNLSERSNNSGLSVSYFCIQSALWTTPKIFFSEKCSFVLIEEKGSEEEFLKKALKQIEIVGKEREKLIKKDTIMCSEFLLSPGQSIALQEAGLCILWSGTNKCLFVHLDHGYIACTGLSAKSIEVIETQRNLLVDNLDEVDDHESSPLFLPMANEFLVRFKREQSDASLMSNGSLVQSVALFLSKEYIIIKLMLEKYRLEIEPCIRGLLRWSDQVDMQQIFVKLFSAYRADMSKLEEEEKERYHPFLHKLYLSYSEAIKTSTPLEKLSDTIVSYLMCSESFILAQNTKKASNTTCTFDSSSTAPSSSMLSHSSASFFASDDASRLSHATTSSELYQEVFESMRTEMTAIGQSSSSMDMGRELKARTDAEYRRLTQS